MSTTPHLGLPLMAAAQAQKHVTHNEALLGLDALVQLAVLDRDLATPPASPAPGDRYIVADAGIGAWAGKGGQIAVWQDDAWNFYISGRGWLAYVIDEGALLGWTGTAWSDAIKTIAEFQNLTALGLGTTADAANPFSAKLNNALWTARTAAEGGTGDLRAKFNKESAAATLSLLFQDGSSGRAEIGLVGDDDLRIKVSPDGAAWKDALRINRSTGMVAFPAGAAPGSGIGNLLLNGNFVVNQRAYASGTALAAGAYGHDRWKAGAGGCAYTFIPAKPDTMITLTSGTLLQVVENINVEGGSYVLSWTGTAQARIGVNGAAPSGAYAASPIVVTGAAAGQAIAVEFNTGTLAKVQLGPGTVETPFGRRPVSTEQLLCMRYCWVSNPAAPKGAAAGFLSGVATAATLLNGAGRSFPVPMRAVPTLTLWNNGVQNQVRSNSTGQVVSLGTPSFAVATSAFGFIVGAAVLTSGTGYDFDIIAEAEL